VSGVPAPLLMLPPLGVAGAELLLVMLSAAPLPGASAGCQSIPPDRPPLFSSTLPACRGQARGVHHVLGRPREALPH
jgi:hypothetical protein